MSSDLDKRLDEVLMSELGDPGLADGLRERIMAALPERPCRAVGSWVYVLLAAAAVVFMAATLAVHSPVELFTSSSRLTVSLMVANFGAFLIAVGFLGWAADAADFEDSFLAMAVQSLARRPLLRLGVKLGYAAAIFLAVLWILRPARILAVAIPPVGQIAGGLGVLLLCGLCFAALGQFAGEDSPGLDRARTMRAVAVVVIVASCAVHYALVAL